MKNISRYLELYCNEYLGENNNFSSDNIEIDKFYSAMIAIIDKLLFENKIDAVKARDFKIKYSALENKSFNYFRREKIDIFSIFKEFKNIIRKE